MKIIGERHQGYNIKSVDIEMAKNFDCHDVGGSNRDPESSMYTIICTQGLLSVTWKENGQE